MKTTQKQQGEHKTQKQGKTRNSKQHIMSYIISVDGNIGSGKSTLVNHLREKYKDSEMVCFLDEPVDDWKKIVDEDGVDILSKFYGDTKK